ncbi:MAG: RNA polymerase sigma factor, partial [Longimicrobiales bacterium]
MGEEEDAVLVEAVRGGCADAFGPLVRRYEREVVALAYSILGDRAEAQDMAQEAFVRAYGNLNVLADPSRFAAWLRRIVFGTCIDRVRAFRPELYRGEGVGEHDEIASSAPNALERLERVELAQRVLDAIAGLPERYRVPLTLFHIDGLSHDKVAAALGVSVGTARSLTTRARRKLAGLLRDHAPEDRPVNCIDAVFDEQESTPRLLHVLNGDSTRYSLEKSDVPGTFTVWADVLHDGPTPGDVSDEEWYGVRSRFIEARGWA